MSHSKERYVKGYRLVYCPEHPNSMTRKKWAGWIYEHILVASTELGRPLTCGEDVHHLDGNKLNNIPGNLQVLSKSEHARIHRPVVLSDRNCAVCGSPLRGRYKVTCSVVCKDVYRNKSVPGVGVLAPLISENTNYEELGRRFHVTGNAVRKWARKYKLIT